MIPSFLFIRGTPEPLFPPVLFPMVSPWRETPSSFPLRGRRWFSPRPVSVHQGRSFFLQAKACLFFSISWERRYHPRILFLLSSRQSGVELFLSRTDPPFIFTPLTLSASVFTTFSFPLLLVGMINPEPCSPLFSRLFFFVKKRSFSFFFYAGRGTFPFFFFFPPLRPFTTIGISPHPCPLFYGTGALFFFHEGTLFFSFPFPSIRGNSTFFFPFRRARILLFATNNTPLFFFLLVNFQRIDPAFLLFFPLKSECFSAKLDFPPPLPPRAASFLV